MQLMPHGRRRLLQLEIEEHGGLQRMYRAEILVEKKAEEQGELMETPAVDTLDDFYEPGGATATVMEFNASGDEAEPGLGITPPGNPDEPEEKVPIKTKEMLDLLEKARHHLRDFDRASRKQQCIRNKNRYFEMLREHEHDGKLPTLRVEPKMQAKQTRFDSDTSRLARRKNALRDVGLNTKQFAAGSFAALEAARISEEYRPAATPAHAGETPEGYVAFDQSEPGRTPVAFNGSEIGLGGSSVDKVGGATPGLAGSVNQASLDGIGGQTPAEWAAQSIGRGGETPGQTPAGWAGGAGGEEGVGQTPGVEGEEEGFDDGLGETPVFL